MFTCIEEDPEESRKMRGQAALYVRSTAPAIRLCFNWWKGKPAGQATEFSEAWSPCSAL